MPHRHIDNGHGIFLMWWNFTISTGFLILVVVLSLWVKPIYLPFVALGFELFLFILIRRNRKARIPACYLIPFICTRILFWSAVVMIGINFIFSHWVLNKYVFLENINREIPYIAQLIIGPITFLICAWALWRKDNLGLCQVCKIRFGAPAERGFLGRMFTQEGRFQNRVLMWMGLICGIISWTYYFVYYVNESYTEVDKMIFVWINVALFCLLTLYMLFRYLGLWSYYCRNENSGSKHKLSTTELRYIIFYDNYIAVRKTEPNSINIISSLSKKDTPVQVSLSLRTTESLFDAIQHFEKLTGIYGADIRMMYSNTSTNADGNIFHYLCFLDEEQKNDLDLHYPGTEWLTFSELIKLINDKQLSPLFCVEIIRLHMISMTWKTYNEDGTRRYPIKHYRPTFKLSDVKDYDVDFYDNKWLFIARNNEDTPFFRLRRFWYRHINGIGISSDTDYHE